MNNMLKRSAIALAVLTSMSAAMPALADNLTGSIYGKAKVGQSIQIVNKETGFKRTITVADNGRFVFSQLPVGKYSVTDGTNTQDITVTIGNGSAANFDGTEIIEVTGSRIAAIDTSTVESSSVFTADQLEILPIARDITSVALLAPGTVKGDSGIGDGKLASFGGASVAENGYFINGFDVTNIRNFIAFADLPFDAIGQQQVKTGGYGAEYGRSLGGVINLVTKRGSNTWKGGGAIYYTPASLREHGTDVVSKNPEMLSSDRFSTYRSSNEYDRLSYNAYVSGPLIEDTLFVFAMLEGRRDTDDTYGRSTSSEVEDTSPLGLLKVDWNINDNNLFEFTYINNKAKEKRYDYSNDDYYASTHDAFEGMSTTESGGQIYIANYTASITEDLTVNLLYGHLDNLADVPSEGASLDCPLVYERLTSPTSSTPIGCWDSASTYRYDPTAPLDEDKRDSLRLGAEWILGDHKFKFGMDSETFTSSHRGQEFTGGNYWRWHRGTGGKVNGVVVPAGETYVRHLTTTSASGSFEVKNKAVYLEDNWQVTDEVMAYVGIRGESFENFNSEGQSFVDSGFEIAPRLGLTWDINGDGNKKLFATVGRYYIPVASNTNIRASGIEYGTEEYFLADWEARNKTTDAPSTLGTQLGSTLQSGSTEAPNPGTVAATNLSPMFQDEFIIGYQQQVEEWILGARYIDRKVKDGMDDYCSHQPFVDWATDEGYDDFDPDSMAQCIMINPGRDLSLAMDLNSDGTLTEVTIPKEYLGLVPYDRTYKALELLVEKPMADGWYLQGSYTHAKSRGNAEGYVNSTLEQEDAGATQDIDNALFQHGSYGPLPNDRKHTFKVFGAYQLTEEITMSANLIVQSGRPINCTGFIPLDKDALGVDYAGLARYSASSFYCDGKLGNRGDYGRTPWTKSVDMGLSYAPSAIDGLVLKVDVRNLLNLQSITEYNETGEIGSATAKQLNPEFLNAVNFQTPRVVSFSARYSF